MGDTIAKDLVKNDDKLKKLGFEISLHDKMPDVVLYREDSDWIYFVESVTSVGPMDAKRVIEVLEMTANVLAGEIFVTTFWILQHTRNLRSRWHGKQKYGLQICQTI